MDRETKARIEKSFGDFDSNGDGKIDLVEFRKLLEKMDSKLGRAEAEAAFDAVDRDENGLIDSGEFVAWWSKQEKKA